MKISLLAVKESAMDKMIVQPGRTLEQRRTVAAWEALERAEALLPPGHPAAWHIERALAALESAWHAQLPGSGREAQGQVTVEQMDAADHA
jgi:hypothetical protein